MLTLTDPYGFIRNAGYVSGGCFNTHRDKHNFFRKYQGFGIKEEVLDYLIYNEVWSVRINWNGSDYYFKTLDFFNSGTSNIHYYSGLTTEKQRVIKLNANWRVV